MNYYKGIVALGQYDSIVYLLQQGTHDVKHFKAHSSFLFLHFIPSDQEVVALAGNFHEIGFTFDVVSALL